VELIERKRKRTAAEEPWSPPQGAQRPAASWNGIQQKKWKWNFFCGWNWRAVGVGFFLWGLRAAAAAVLRKEKKRAPTSPTTPLIMEWRPRRKTSGNGNGSLLSLAGMESKLGLPAAPRPCSTTNQPSLSFHSHEMKVGWWLLRSLTRRWPPTLSHSLSLLMRGPTHNKERWSGS